MTPYSTSGILHIRYPVGGNYAKQTASHCRETHQGGEVCRRKGGQGGRAIRRVLGSHGSARCTQEGEVSMTSSKWGVWQAVCRALKDGRLKREPCACGNTRDMAHHDDYSKPLEVRWLCARCHAKEHPHRPGARGRRMNRPLRVGPRVKKVPATCRNRPLDTYPRIEDSAFVPIPMRVAATVLGRSTSYPYQLARSGHLAIYAGNTRRLAVTRESLDSLCSLQNRC